MLECVFLLVPVAGLKLVSYHCASYILQVHRLSKLVIEANAGVTAAVNLLSDEVDRQSWADVEADSPLSLGSAIHKFVGLIKEVQSFRDILMFALDMGVVAQIKEYKSLHMRQVKEFLRSVTTLGDEYEAALSRYLGTRKPKVDVPQAQDASWLAVKAIHTRYGTVKREISKNHSLRCHQSRVFSQKWGVLICCRPCVRCIPAASGT
jgi:hypothetical protein